MNDTTDPTDQIGKFFDVVPPNKAAASPTSRPVITNSEPQNDPMVKKTVAAPAMSFQPTTKDSAEPPKPELNKSVAPTAQTSSAPSSAASSLGVSEEIRQAMVETHGSSPPRDESNDESSSISVEPAPTEPAPQPTAPPDASTTQSPNLPRNAAATPEKPSNQVIVKHHKSTAYWRRTWFMVLALVVVIIIVDLLLDLGIIKTNFPHTHFFNK